MHTSKRIQKNFLSAASCIDRICYYNNYFEKLAGGQGYDGSGSLAGIRNGAISVLQKYLLATYIHCCSHTLNLSITSSCFHMLVRNMLGSVSEVCKFFEQGKKPDKTSVRDRTELPDVKK